ncbi:hypothetical protein OS175_06615 [Marinicella sp. S1101]|uniref:hypothetical protein n=1 Tax=Marinicella marina TaxID=2996016 RepID=UPI002260E458|nr:hypothetical protein [Marinicella marina]MCX7553546.1 hypothetical protein [Marinicella marina]MDJ1140170.1 hypothetical protein [Marinicella marina]
MTTQSKSVLLPFLVVAAIIFVAALVWKMVGSDEPVTSTTEVAVTEAKPAVKATTNNNPQPVIEVVDYDEPAPLIEPVTLTEEEQQAIREQTSANMGFGMRFPTVERAIEGLKVLRENGNDDVAEKLIVYINTQFPNESIPADLID